MVLVKETKVVLDSGLAVSLYIRKPNEKTYLSQFNIHRCETGYYVEKEDLDFHCYECSGKDFEAVGTFETYEEVEVFFEEYTDEEYVEEEKERVVMTGPTKPIDELLGDALTTILSANPWFSNEHMRIMNKPSVDELPKQISYKSWHMDIADKDNSDVSFATWLAKMESKDEKMLHELLGVWKCGETPNKEFLEELAGKRVYVVDEDGGRTFDSHLPMAHLLSAIDVTNVTVSSAVVKKNNLTPIVINGVPKGIFEMRDAVCKTLQHDGTEAKVVKLPYNIGRVDEDGNITLNGDGGIAVKLGGLLNDK
ncbi:MAG: hypothetical protein ACRC92_26205 [Peptostreptococcaceae bacterium]